MMKIMDTPKGQDGFTLIEALVAMVVLTIGIFSLYTMQVTAMRGNTKAQVITTASNWASTQVEDILTRPYEDLEDVNLDGTNQDELPSPPNDPDGIDDDGDNFGLDNVSAATADGVINTSNGRYTLYWNVAVDVPVKGTKTVRVHVQDNNNIMQNVVVFNYIRQEGI